MTNLEFTVNGRSFSLEDRSGYHDHNLLYFLRQQDYTGCKQVCGEGGCGACTVISSRWNQSRITHGSVAACLVPLPFVHATQVTTIEGLKELTDQKMHPVSEAFYQLGASQCGFCTPGFIMAIFARLSERPLPKKVEIERIFDGNLCRCTGYRPLLEAAQVFCEDAPDSKWKSEFLRCRTLDSVFPEKFKHPPKTVSFQGKETTWILPASLPDLLKTRSQEGDSYSKMIGGNTDVGYKERYRPRHFDRRVSLSGLSELHSIKWGKKGVRIGAGVTIKELCTELAPRTDDSGINALLNQCRFLANNQIRNVATVGGGVMNFSHYSDLIPIWIALRAQLRFHNREVALYQLAQADGSLNFEPRPDDIFLSFFVPYSEERRLVSAFKYARRRMDSITLLSAGVSCHLDENNLLQDFILSFDGLGTSGFRAVRTESLLTGKVFTAALLQEALNTLEQEVKVSITTRLPDRLHQHQIRLALGTVIRFQAEVASKFYDESDSRATRLTSRLQEQTHRSRVSYSKTNVGILGEAVPHRNARHQVTGKARYTADHTVPNCLYASIVASPAASGKIISIDPEPALKHPQVVAFFSARDIPGKNLFGFRIEDEEVLASDRVSYVGQPVGVLVAKSEKIAREQSWNVQIKIDVEDPLLTFDQAIAAASFHGKSDGYLLKQGYPTEALKKADQVVSGVVTLPGQSHFYFEPQSALVVPKDDGYTVHSSTQSPSNVVDHISALLSIQKNSVQVQVGRLGGGFGGKQFRAGPIAAIAALSAQKTGRPVKLTLDRAEDMAYCPGRSPAQARYQAGFSQEGAIEAIEIEFFLSGGHSNDYSADITEAATLLMDSCYQVKNIQVRGRCLKTNFGSNTATRGFGKPQASAIMETILDHGATTLGLDAAQLRRKNLYRKGQKTITQTLIDDDVIERCWDRAVEKANYQKLRSGVDAFNKNNKWLKRGLAVVGSRGNMGFLESDDLNRGLALLHIMRDGTVSVNHSGIEMGQGINTRMAQVAAAALGVSLNQVTVTDTQSSLIPNTPPTTMVATDLIGMAIVNASEKLKKVIDRFKGSFAERIEQAYQVGETLSATGIHTAPRLAYDYEKQQGDVSYFFVWGAAVSLVEVDVISGSFRILKSEIVQDCGKSLNPHLDVGQVEGGFMFGVGYYMMEEMIYSHGGGLISNNVSGYKLPSCGDVPLEWNLELLSYEPTGKGIHNSKGIGESNLQLALSVYFATKDAVGAARKEGGMSPVFSLGFPASVDRVAASMPELKAYLGNRH